MYEAFTPLDVRHLAPQAAITDQAALVATCVQIFMTVTPTSSLRFYRQNESRSNTAWTVVLSLLVNDLGNSPTHMKSSSIVKISINAFKNP